MGHIQNLLKDQRQDSISKPTGASVVVRPFWKCVVSEFVASFLLIFIGCGVGLKYSEEDEDKPMVHVALCWGFLIATLAQTMHYSCDINPAVTIARTVTGKMSIVNTLIYIVVQCLGCLAGAYVLKLLTPEGILGDYGVTKIAPEMSPARAAMVEGLCTFFLVFTVFSASDEEREDLKGSIPLSIGLCVMSLILLSAGYTAASFNPARSLGPAIVAGVFEHHWVYWVGPICGGIIGGLAYHHLFRLRRVPVEVESPTAV